MVVVSQGPLLYKERIEAAWPGFEVLHSTTSEKGLNLGRNVLYLPPCEPGRQNVWLQRQTTLEGLKWAKSLGHRRALKIRSDLVPTSADFVKLLTGERNFLFWHNYRGGYPVDYCMEGDIDYLIDLWSFTEEPPFPEAALIPKAKNLSFFGPKLTKENDLFWIKNNIYLTEYQKDPLYCDKTSLF